jgi:hypothetical protein
MFNVIVFTRPSLRNTSCGIYFLSSSICNICTILMSHLSRLIIKNRINSIICRIRLYSIHVFAHLSHYIIVMASFDRFILCSKITLQRYF